MKVAISIPVHEKPEVIVDQIRNILYFVPDSIIVLHVNQEFYVKNSDASFNTFDKVLINPEHLLIQWGNIIEAHLSNYKYLSQRNEDFQYFLLHASNDMYIKKGIEDYIQAYKAGFARHVINSETTLWWPGKYALKDMQLKEIMKFCRQTKIVASQVEGSFYCKELMDKIYKIITNIYIPSGIQDRYPREEVYFSTIAEKMIADGESGMPTTFSEVHKFDRIDWMVKLLLRKCLRKASLYAVIERYLSSLLFKTHFYDLNIRTIKKIAQNNSGFLKRNQYLYDGNEKYKLYSNQLYSVKRVKRKYNNRIRSYIRNHIMDQK